VGINLTKAGADKFKDYAMPCKPKKGGGSKSGICHRINNILVGEVPILTPLNGVRVFFTVFVILRDTTTPVTLDGVGTWKSKRFD
jgi:hypothetical protein